MLKRLVTLIARAFDIRLWIALPAAVGAIAAPIGLAAALYAAGADSKWSDAFEWLAGAFLWMAAAYFLVRSFRGLFRLEARVDRFLEGKNRTLRLLAWIAEVAALLLLALVLFYLPLHAGSARVLYEELFGFDFRVFLAVFALSGALCVALLRVGRGSFDRFGAERVRQAGALGACAVLLLFALSARSLLPRARPFFESFGADLPGPTLVVIETYDYWLLAPLLAAVIAACLSIPVVRARSFGKIAFNSLTGLVVVATLALPAVLLAMLLPFAGCSGLSFHDTGLTRLHAAAMLGHTDSAVQLIGRGENVKAQDFSGDTPLHMAVGHNHIDTVRALLERGADAGARNDNGAAPVHRAAVRSRDGTGLLELLLAHGAQVDVATASGDTPLHYAARAGNADAAELLLAKGADVNALGKDGTPLDVVYLAPGKPSPIADLLVRHGAARATKAELDEFRRTLQEREQAARARLAQQSEVRGCGA